MIRRSLILLLPLALLLAACQDQSLPTALAPEGAIFSTLNVGCTHVPQIDVPALIEAIERANEAPGHDIIELAPNCLYIFADAYEGENGLPPITDDLTIDGNGSIVGSPSPDDSGPEFRIFQIDSDATVSISGLTIVGGRTANAGGILNFGTLTLANSTVTANLGSIANFGTLTLSHSTVSNNRGGIGNTGTLTLANSNVTANLGGIANTGTLTLSHSTVSNNGTLIGGGGGIFNSNTGTLTLTHSIVSNNAAPIGGGILNLGTLMLTNSTIRGNFSTSTTNGGGGIANLSGSATLTNSTVWGNSSSSATNGGGGILNLGTLTLTNSTVSGNTAPLGGGIFTAGALTLNHSTVWGNSASSATNGGGGIFRAAGTLTLQSSLIAENAATVGGPDIDISDSFGIGVTASYSLIGSAAGHAFSHGSNGNIVGVSADDLQLGPLALNTPGSTLTHALLEGSPALDHIPVGTNGCGVTNEGGGSKDQRGVSRPQGEKCDIGAFELEQPSEIALESSSWAMTNAPSGNASRTLTIPAPAGVVEGELLLAQITFEKGSDAGTDAQLTPSGWTRVRRTNRGSDLGQAIFYRVATADEPAAYTFPFRQAVKAAGAVLRYSGVDTSSPIVASSGGTGDSRTLTAPGVTAEDGSMLLAFYGFKKKNTTLSVPQGMTGLYNAQNPQDVTLRAAEELRESAGATGNRVSTPLPTNSDKWVAQLVALRPAN